MSCKISTTTENHFLGKLQPVVVLLFILCCGSCLAQEQAPLIFRQQEKYVNKIIHRHLKTDTIVETSEASIHLYFATTSNKQYLLLLHGMGANAASNWFKQIPYLSKHYNLIAPDLIYFGKSTSKSNDFSPEFQAKQINELMRKLNITGPIHVMGFSYGGLVAAVYNQLFHDNVEKLIIIDGPVKYFSGQMADSCARFFGASGIAALLAPQTIKDFNSLKRAALSRNMPIPKGIKKKLIAHFFAPYVDIRKQQIDYLFRYQQRYQNYNYNFPSTSTLFVWGAKDGVVPLSVGKALNAAYPAKSQLLVFKKAKHDAQFRYSKKLNKAIADFLKNM